MKRERLIRLLSLAGFLLAAGFLAAYTTGTAVGDNTTPITVTATTPTVSTPGPLPAPLPKPQPAPVQPRPRPVSHPSPAPKPVTPAPAPAAVPSSNSSGSAVQSAPRPTPVRPKAHARPRPTRHARPRPHVRAHVRHAKPTPKPSAPARETEPATSGSSKSHSQLLFFLFTAILLAVGVATVVRSPRARARWAGTGARRRRPETREVIAELVHTAPLPTSTAVLTAPATTTEPPRTEREPVFEPELLLPPAAVAQAQPDAPTEIAEPTAEAVVEEPTEEFCEIAVWRGYAKSRFFARLELENGNDEVAVGESPTFRLRGNGIPERTQAAAAAHAALLRTLIEEGWEVEGQPEPWFANRLRREIGDREPASPALTT